MCTIEFTRKSNTTFSTVIDIDYSKLANADGNPISVEVSNCTISHTGSAAHSSGYTSSGINTNKNHENKEDKTNDEPVHG